ncbi:uncharacterized protein [Henckelia pumila]|uniref:uncharacterized protein n=1 Tax=Henckelia pumila TaxID=405737 RepID=UPI003C6DEE6C
MLKRSIGLLSCLVEVKHPNCIEKINKAVNLAATICARAQEYSLDPLYFGNRFCVLDFEIIVFDVGWNDEDFTGRTSFKSHNEEIDRTTRQQHNERNWGDFKTQNTRSSLSHRQSITVSADQIVIGNSWSKQLVGCAENFINLGGIGIRLGRCWTHDRGEVVIAYDPCILDDISWEGSSTDFGLIEGHHNLNSDFVKVQDSGTAGKYAKQGIIKPIRGTNQTRVFDRGGYRARANGGWYNLALKTMAPCVLNPSLEDKTVFQEGVLLWSYLYWTKAAQELCPNSERFRPYIGPRPNMLEEVQASLSQKNLDWERGIK